MKFIKPVMRCLLNLSGSATEGGQDFWYNPHYVGFGALPSAGAGLWRLSCSLMIDL